MNVLPWPTPSLRTAIVPPCRSTSVRATARPSPRPPCLRSSPRSPCTNRSKICGSSVRCDADPVVATLDDHGVVLGAGAQRDVATRLGVLRGVGDQVREDLGEPLLVAVDDEAVGHVDGQVVVTLLDERRSHLDGTGHDRRHLDRLPAQIDRAAPDRDTSSRSSTSRARWRTCRSTMSHSCAANCAATALHDLQRGQGRRKRVAQLVAEHRHELVLRAIGGLRLGPRGIGPRHAGIEFALAILQQRAGPGQRIRQPLDLGHRRRRRGSDRGRSRARRRPRP